MSYTKCIATLSIALVVASFGGAWLVRANGSGNVSAAEVKTATGLGNKKFQLYGSQSRFEFATNREVNYDVPCRANSNGNLLWVSFNSVETDVPMSAVPQLNGNSQIWKFDLTRAVGGTIVTKDSNGNVVGNPSCPEFYHHDVNDANPLGFQTAVTPVSGGLFVSYTDDHAVVHTNQIVNGP